ncbi:MAG TPA: tetratricopeptide repeat protein [Pyrinomonadaceae bacterium]|jgi:tetratricopeptide (TPR) repeat protein
MTSRSIASIIEQIFVTRHEQLIGLCLVALLSLGLTLCAATRASAQMIEDYQGERRRAFGLWDQNKHTEAVPLLEELAKANPSDVAVLARLGFSLYSTTATMKDPAERKKTRDRAREVLLRARELGDNSSLSESTLDVLSSPDTTDIPFSDLKEADAAMHEGEAAFAKGEMDEALAAYERALKFDPRLYWAAVFTGDVHFRKGVAASDRATQKEEFDKAGEWFARAIAINGNHETAYRYWGDVLMRQGKMTAALDKFIEAFIHEPYSKNAHHGLMQWAEKNGVTLAHPKIDIPNSVSSTKPGEVTITIDPLMLGKEKDETGSSAWLMYGMSRALWMSGKDGKLSEKFARQYPDEKVYRHSLAEEMDALSLVITSLKEQMKDKKIKRLDPSLASLLKLSDAGLLEAYILLARPDQGIARDYPAYLKANPDKLRRYVVEYVLTGGGGAQATE